MPVINLVLVDANTGCIDPGSIQKVEGGLVQLITNEPGGEGLRQFSGSSFSSSNLLTNATYGGYIGRDMQKTLKLSGSIYDGLLGYILWRKTVGINPTVPVAPALPVEAEMVPSDHLNIISYLWDFGDGETSTEQAPTHTYQMPGSYTVTLTATDNVGNTYVSTFAAIQASEYPADFMFGKTDFSFRQAVKPEHGIAITQFGGEKWLWPPAPVSSAKGLSALNENISRVIDAETMQLFQIGIPEVWTDRAGTADESEIACDAWMPEISSRLGLHEMLRMTECHFDVLSYDQARYARAPGYTERGLRLAQIIALEALQERRADTSDNPDLSSNHRR